MAVGVPETDVFAAADAVLARGERPTVERVRLELGRGSPARVGALLDQWWEQLAGRLRGETRLPGLPAEVTQAFIAIWQQATTLAQGVVEQSLAGQRQVLAEEREALSALEAHARLDVAQARQQVAEAAAARRGAETRLTDLERLLIQRQVQIDELRAQRDELQAQRDEAHTQLAEVRQHLHETREQAEQARVEQQRYTRNVEDRAYREIDRAREEAKALAAQLKEAGGRQQTLQQDLQASQAALAEVREQRGVAQAQCEALQRERDQALEAYTTACEQQQVLQQQQHLTQRELAELREQAAASRALAEILDQQLAGATTGHAPEGRSRSARKSTRKDT